MRKIIIAVITLCLLVSGLLCVLSCSKKSKENYLLEIRLNEVKYRAVDSGTVIEGFPTVEFIVTIKNSSSMPFLINFDSIRRNNCFLVINNKFKREIIDVNYSGFSPWSIPENQNFTGTLYQPIPNKILTNGDSINLHFIYLQKDVVPILVCQKKFGGNIEDNVSRYLHDLIDTELLLIAFKLNSDYISLARYSDIYI